MTFKSNSSKIDNPGFCTSVLIPISYLASASIINFFKFTELPFSYDSKRSSMSCQFDGNFKRLSLKII